MSLPFPCALLLALSAAESAAQHTLHSFERVQLTDEYYSEGINAADFNNDGVMDVVYGPFWFAGPEYREKHLIYPAVPQPREGYANHFFAWPCDFDGDGWVDVFTAGFPGTPAHVYRNPGKEGTGAPWEKHEVFDWVSNESPHFTNLIGDERSELVCTRDGYFGYAEVNWREPFSRWTFHPISERIAPERFGHGLGVGDVNGDGRLDIVMKDGWFEQPADLAVQPVWTLHKVPFAPRGGAEMYVYDVNGDHRNDVITSLAAHEYGLSWFEQTAEGFKEHLIMGDRPGQSHYGIAFSDMHSVQLADMDGDGLKDIVTGKTYRSHHNRSPGWDSGAVVYWFKLVRGENGVDWVPNKADGDSSIGRQVIVKDVNGDGLPDILAGGMKGAHVLLHQTKSVTQDEWLAAQPKRSATVEPPRLRGSTAPAAAAFNVTGAIEGESLKVTASKGTAAPQSMKNFKAERWSGGSQLFWRGGGEGDMLEFDITVADPGSYKIESVFTVAPDYAIVQLTLDGRALGESIDLFDPKKVATTGVLTHSLGTLGGGTHKLGIRITGANPAAKPSSFVGLDYVRLVKGD